MLQTERQRSGDSAFYGPGVVEREQRGGGERSNCVEGRGGLSVCARVGMQPAFLFGGGRERKSLSSISSSHTRTRIATKPFRSKHATVDLCYNKLQFSKKNRLYYSKFQLSKNMCIFSVTYFRYGKKNLCYIYTIYIYIHMQ